MRRLRSGSLLGALFSTAAVLAVGTSSALGNGGPLPTTSGRVACAAAARQAPLALDTPAGAARTAGLHTYDDYIEDVVSAPDICAANLVTNDNVVVTMAIHAHDRSDFDPLDSYSVLLDTDSNPATGAGPDQGAAAGAEFVIDLFDGRSQLSAWNGAAFAAVMPQPQIPTAWVEDFGPVLQIERAALGNPQRFNLILRTANGADLDLAPDTGAWSYVVAPLRLTARELMLGPARAGKPLLAVMTVERSDFEILLDEGKVACNATLGGKKLVARSGFAGVVVTCSWRIPRSARGKRVHGSVTVTFQQVTAKRAFAVRVR